MLPSRLTTPPGRLLLLGTIGGEGLARGCLSQRAYLLGQHRITHDWLISSCFHAREAEGAIKGLHGCSDCRQNQDTFQTFRRNKANLSRAWTVLLQPSPSACTALRELWCLVSANQDLSILLLYCSMIEIPIIARRKTQYVHSLAGPEVL